MKISFDLDDTLIPAKRGDFEVEKRTFLQRILGIELLRKGTASVFQQLIAQGHTVGIYTTSYRSVFTIKLMFWSYGIRPHFVINEKTNRRELGKHNIRSSKYPPTFGVDWHIDDSQGVAMEGERLDFEVLVLKRNEVSWEQKVLGQIDRSYDHEK